jgi:hypothetical protein
LFHVKFVGALEMLTKGEKKKRKKYFLSTLSGRGERETETERVEERKFVRLHSQSS